MKRLKKVHLAPGFMRSRWFIVGVGIVVFLGGAGTYVWWSQGAWGAYEKKYLGVRQDIDTKLTQAFSLQSDTSDERRQKTEKLASLSADIEKIDDSFCHQNVLISWQGAFGEYKTYEESCKATTAAVRAFNGQLRPAVEYLQQEQALAKLLAASPTQAEVAESDFEGQLTSWRSVYEGIRNANASGGFDPVKQAAVGATEGVIKNWEEVIAAHQAKDKARYLKATQALAAAYDNLQAIASTGTVQVTEVAVKLQETYARLK